jgi:hypothetical protein
MRIVCAIHPPDAIAKILEWFDISSRPLPIAPALLENNPEKYIN